MRRSSGAACRKIEASTSERPDCRSLGGASNVFLTLPSVSSQVPVVSTSNVNGKRWAEIALLLLELVDEKEIVVRKDFDPRSVIDEVLVKWVSKHCGDLKVLSSFNLVSSLLLSDQNVYSYDECRGEPKEKQVWHLGLVASDSVVVLSIKEKVESLEARFPGLGFAAAEYAETASCRTVTMFSPNVAFAHAQHVYWYGQETDEDFLEELKSYYDDDDEAMADAVQNTVLPSAFLQSFGPFFATSKVKVEKGQLEAIAASQDVEAAEVARIMLNIDRLNEEGARLPDLYDREAEQVYFSCLMRWDEGDELFRCYDDYVEMANQCSDSYTDLFGVADVPLDVEAFQKWRVTTEKGFELYSQLDQLMQRIGTVIN